MFYAYVIMFGCLDLIKHIDTFFMGLLQLGYGSAAVELLTRYIHL